MTEHAVRALRVQVFGKPCAACDGGDGSCEFVSKYGSACETDHAVRNAQRQLILQVVMIVRLQYFVGFESNLQPDAVPAVSLQ